MASATMRKRSAARAARDRSIGVVVRHWAWAMVAVVLTISGFFVVSMPKAAIGTAQQAQGPLSPVAAFAAKTVVYELSTADPAPATVAYLDQNGESVRVEITVPWSVTLTIPAGDNPAGITAQTQGSSLACRILLDGVERAKDEATRSSAAVNCNVMSI